MGWMYWILAVATLLGGVAAAWFFWDKARGTAHAQTLKRAARESPELPRGHEERKADLIAEWKGRQVTLSQMNTGKAARLLGPVRGRSTVTILDCNDMYVTIGVGDSSRSILLRMVDVSHDNSTDRPELQERVE